MKGERESAREGEVSGKGEAGRNAYRAARIQKRAGRQHGPMGKETGFKAEQVFDARLQPEMLHQLRDGEFVMSCDRF